MKEMKKKILITRITGFLRNHLAKALLIAGYEVVALKRKSFSLRRVESIVYSIFFLILKKSTLINYFVIGSNIVIASD